MGMSLRLYARARLLAGSVMVLLLAALALAASARGAQDPTPAERLREAMTASLTAYVARSATEDPHGWTDGVFGQGAARCMPCQSSAALGAAVLARPGEPDDERLRALSMATIDRLITTRQRPDGAFEGPGEVGEIPTAFLTADIGQAIIAGRAWLPAAKRARWRRSVVEGAEYLIDNGNLQWYTNGNIVLANTLTMYVAWRLSGQRRFARAYAKAWRFALRPPQPRWRGFGLHVVSGPKRPGGAGGAAYLGEWNGQDAPGYDPEYTAVQADVAARLLLLSGEPRVRRLTNLLWGMVSRRVDNDWMLDTSNGTRHTDASRKVPMLSAAPAVLAVRAGRSKIEEQLPAQVAGAERFLLQTRRYSNPDSLKALGGRLGTALMALERPPVQLAPTSAGERRRQNRRRARASRLARN